MLYIYIYIYIHIIKNYIKCTNIAYRYKFIKIKKEIIRFRHLLKFFLSKRQTLKQHN